MERIFFVLGSFSGALGVVLGAFGAHALRARLSTDLLNSFETGVRYQMYHAFAVLAVAFAISRYGPSSLVSAAGLLFILGTLVFSGSLYILAATRYKWLGAITPLGGIAFIAGWLCLAFGMWPG
jgi:uncharacterized membrane protein YgdD (TMEM256/DUF423 family)